MAINRYQQFVNPGQIEVDPYELPFDELYTILANKQKAYDIAEENLPDNLMPEHGYITKELANTYQQKYAQDVKNVQNQFYQTGQFPTNEAKELASRMANDPIRKALENDYNYMTEVDKLEAQGNFNEYAQSFKDLKTGQYKQITEEDLMNNPNIASYYSNVAPKDVVGFVNDDTQKRIKEFTDSAIKQGRLSYNENGSINYKMAVPQYDINGNLIGTNYKIETIKGGITPEWLIEHSEGSLDGSSSWIETRYNNRKNVDELYYWNEKFKQDNKREPTLDEFKELYYGSNYVSTYHKTSEKITPLLTESPSNGSGGNKINSNFQYYEKIKGIPHGVKYATELNKKLEALGYNIDNFSITDAENFGSSLDSELKEKQKKLLSEPTWNDMMNYKNTLMASLSDENSKNILFDIPMENIFEYTSTVDNITGEVNAEVKVNRNLLEENGLDEDEINTIQSNFSNINNDKIVDYYKLKKLKDSYEQLKNEAYDEAGVSALQEFKKEKINLKNQYLEKTFDKEFVPIIQNKLKSNPNYLSNSDQGYVGLVPIYNSQNQIVDIVSAKTYETNEYQKKIKDNNYKIGDFNKVSNLNLQISEAKQTNFGNDFVEKELEKNGKYSVTDEKFKNKMSKLNDIYRFETPTYTYAVNSYLAESDKVAFNQWKEDNTEYFAKYVLRYPTNDIKWVTTNEELSSTEIDSFHEFVNGVVLKFDGNAATGEYKGENQLFNKFEHQFAYDSQDDFVLQVRMPDLKNANMSQYKKGDIDIGKFDKDAGWIEVKLDNHAKQKFLQLAGAENMPMILQDTKKKVEKDLELYGVGSFGNSYTDLENNQLTSFYNIDYSLEGNGKVKARMKIGDSKSTVNMTFNTPFELSQMREDFDLSLDLLMTSDNPIETIEQIKSSFVDKRANDGWGMDISQANAITNELLNIASKATGKAKFNIDNKTYNVNINSAAYVNLQDYGFIVSGMNYGIPKVHNSIIPNLSRIVQMIPNGVITNGLRSDEDVKKLIKDGYEADPNSLHKYGLGVDIDGNQQRLLEVAGYLKQNMNEYGLAEVKFHGQGDHKHLHISFTK